MSENVKKNIWKSYLFNFFISMHLMGAVLVPFFTDWGGISFFEIMLLQTWFMFCVFILEIPTGTIADYIGRKHSLILAAGINAVGVLVYSSSPNFFIFMVGETLWATAVALYSGAGEAFIYDTLKDINETEKSKKIYSNFESWGLMGLIAAAPLGSVIAFFLGLRMTLFLMIFPLTTAFLIGFTFKEPKRDLKDSEGRKKSYFSMLKEGIKYFRDSKPLKILASSMISVGIMAWLMVWIYQPILMHLNVNIIFFGIIHASFLITEIIIMTNFDNLEKLFKSKERLVLISALLTGIFFLFPGILLLFPIPVQIMLPLLISSIIIVCGFGFTRRILLINYMNKHIEASERATILSTVNMFHTLTVVFAFPFFGLLVECSLVIPLIVFGIMAIIFSIMFRVDEKYLLD